MKGAPLFRVLCERVGGDKATSTEAGETPVSADDSPARNFNKLSFRAKRGTCCLPASTRIPPTPPPREREGHGFSRATNAPIRRRPRRELTLSPSHSKFP